MPFGSINGNEVTRGEKRMEAGVSKRIGAEMVIAIGAHNEIV